ncbi:hypothetical protein MRX96_031539 [Rhipicephalus microplus]
MFFNPSIPHLYWLLPSSRPGLVWALPCLVRPAWVRLAGCVHLRHSHPLTPCLCACSGLSEDVVARPSSLCDVGTCEPLVLSSGVPLPPPDTVMRPETVTTSSEERDLTGAAVRDVSDLVFSFSLVSVN